MRLILLLIAVSFMPACVAPTFTVYERGTAVDSAGNKKVVAVKRLQFYSDLDGDASVEVSRDRVAVRASGGINNSRLAWVNYDGAAKVGRATIQPIVWATVTGGVLDTAAGAASSAAGP